MSDTHIKFGCPHCGQSGEVVWNGDEGDRNLVRLSDGFHIDEGRAPAAKHLVICNACEEIDPPCLVIPSH